MRQRRKTSRAVFLISVLFFTLLVTMFVSAAIALAPSAAARALADGSVSSADRAAKSGIDWARNRLSSNPGWTASTAATFSVNGLTITEGSGQVVGWMPQGSGWSRFRIRFNYQDGAASSAANSDNMDDPPTLWTDFPYVSSNNSQGGGAKIAPLAANGSSYNSGGPWPTLQSNVPPAALLLSVEGCSGNGVTLGGAVPTGFSGSVVYTKVIQTVLKFTNNQPILDAAVSSAGALNLTTYSQNAAGWGSYLNTTTAGQPVRLRTKSSMGLNSTVQSSNADLRYVSSLTKKGLSSNIIYGTDSSSGFYQIPANKVRAASGNTISAGVYQVNSDGSVTYFDMNYPTYVAASPPAGGVPATLPTGMTPTVNPGSGPKWLMSVTQDLSVTQSSGGSTDLAIVPDGGAPSQQGAGSAPAAPSENSTQSYVRNPPAPSLSATLAYDSIAFTTALYNNGGSMTSFVPLTYNLSSRNDANVTIGLDGTVSFTGPPGSQATEFERILETMQRSSTFADFASAVGYTDAPAPPIAGQNTPVDVQLTLGSPGASITLANNVGNLTIGAQVQGNGAALVSSGNISLIGTSNTLSTNPNAALGLDLYSQGSITIDPFHLPASGSSSVAATNLQGVIYAWQGINVLGGNSTTSAPFNMTGAMIAYGGNPSGSPGSAGAGSGQTSITGSVINITYDPSYLAGLLNSGPFTLGIVSWHEF